MMSANDRTNAWSAFLHAHAALIEALEAELQDRHNLALSWFDVLLTLDRAPRGELRMQDLAREVLLSKSGLTRLFDRMEQAGLVERKSCPEDRRGTLAALTSEGRKTLRRAMPAHAQGVEEHFFAHLTADEAAAMQSAFDKILAALGRRAEPCGVEEARASAIR